MSIFITALPLLYLAVTTTLKVELMVEDLGFGIGAAEMTRAYPVGGGHRLGVPGPGAGDVDPDRVNGGAKRDHLGGVRRDRLAVCGLVPVVHG